MTGASELVLCCWVCDIVRCNLKASLCSLCCVASQRSPRTSSPIYRHQMHHPSSTGASQRGKSRSGGAGAPQNQLDDRRLRILLVLTTTLAQRRYTAKNSC